MKNRKKNSQIIEEILNTAYGLHEIGLIDEERMEEYEKLKSEDEKFNKYTNKTII